tara:strand:+ start:917 stop:1408 length:492 start_codon:yes stop_codon:yes gene_type:complete
MNYFKISLGIFLALAASRFVPHPPNFTSLIALSFYMPAIFGRKFIPVLMICFMFTDLIIGIHNTVLFTWGSVLIIGLMSIHFKNGISKRILGSLAGAIIFYLISNFGVWILGAYEYSLKGIIECYTLALPFFTHTVISTLVFASVIEVLIKIYYFAKVKIINQ